MRMWILFTVLTGSGLLLGLAGPDAPMPTWGGALLLLTGMALGLMGRRRAAATESSPPLPRPSIDPPSTGRSRLTGVRRADTLGIPAVGTRPAEPDTETRQLQELLEAENGRILTSAIDTARYACKAQAAGLFLPGRGSFPRLRAWSTDAPGLRTGMECDSSMGILHRALRGETEVLDEPDLPLEAAPPLFDPARPARALLAVRGEVADRMALAWAQRDAPGAFGPLAADHLRSLLELADLLSQRARTMRQDSRILRVLRSLAALERRLSSVDDEEQVLADFAAHLPNSLGLDAWFLVTPPAPGLLGDDDPNEAPMIVACAGRTPAGMRGRRLPSGGTHLVGLVLQKGEGLRRQWNDGQPPPLLVSENPEPWLSSSGEVLLLPLPAGEDGRRGCFVALRESASGFGTLEREVLGSAAAALGLVLARVRAATRHRWLATRDGLTGLWNHRRFQELARTALERSRRTGRPISLVLTDIDHFKQVNDRHGHPVGDHVLRELARRLRQLSDISGHDAARYGGEEFVALLSEVDTPAALRWAESLRHAVADEPVVLPGGGTLPVTLSAGVATIGRHGRTIPELVEGADQALYRAKRTGRNRVEEASPIPGDNS